MLVGIAPLTMVRTTAGRSEYVYLGAQAPADILPEDAIRLVAEGFLADVDEVAVADVLVVPDDPGTGAAGEGVTLERPKNMAAKAAWAEYRIRQSLLTEDLVEEVTKPQLQDDGFMATFLEQARARAEATAAAEQEAAAEQAAAEQARVEAEAESQRQAAQAAGS